MFTYPMEVKSVITRPSHGHDAAGRRPLSRSRGIAWSGYGKIKRVEVSADGGKSWAQAALSEPVLSKSLTRFRHGVALGRQAGRAQSRARRRDRRVQPDARELHRASAATNATITTTRIQAWSIAASGEVSNVYA